ncbi:hypothetical protein C8R42DRAFT_650555 [Lentinula raphanica]|nr:hypothetical protein C8R42DRAFT_650555 [Lentinula raphanica]
MAQNSANVKLNLFPEPNPVLPHALSPTRWPGRTLDSTDTLQRLLEDNHEKWHVFFNNIGFHNHISHRLLALWALGANKEALKAAYDFDSMPHKQRPAFSSPEKITHANFREHLRDEKYYNAYLEFFTESILVQKREISSVLEEFVFASQTRRTDLNAERKSGGSLQPLLQVTFFEGLLHALIHVGYGLELGLPGMIIEGLAIAAVHKPAPGFEILVASSLRVLSDGDAGYITSGLKSLSVGTRAASSLHAFTILARVMEDPALEIKNIDVNDVLAFLGDNGGEKSKILRQYADQWSLDSTDPKDIERRIQDLQWMNVLIYTVAGFQRLKSGEFRADFFLMHLVTTSLFLPSFVAYLTPSSQETLLRSYLGISLAIYVARGRPKINPAPLFEVEMDDPILDPMLDFRPPLMKLPSSTREPNLWLPVIERAILHPDDHLAKFQRAVAHYANLYGYTPKGYFNDGLGIELTGAEQIDGTLFARAGALTQRRLGRDRGGQTLPSYWDFKGFYKREGGAE